MLFIPSILIGIAHGMLFPTTQALFAQLAPTTNRGGFMAVGATVVPLGQAIGPILAGLAFSAWEIKGVFYAGSVFAMAIFVLLNYLIPRGRRANYS